MVAVQLAKELRQKRVGWLMCEYFGDEFAERLHAGVIDLEEPLRERDFDEFLEIGCFEKELTRVQILESWKEAGLLKDLKTFRSIEMAFKSATHSFSRRWLTKFSMMFLAEPEHEFYYSQGEYNLGFEWRWSVVPINELYFDFCVFLLHQDTEQARNLHMRLVDRWRNYVDWSERMETNYREKRINGNSFRELGERMSNIFLLSPNKRDEAIEALQQRLQDRELVAIDAQWRRTWEWDSAMIQAFMDSKGWDTLEMSSKIGLRVSTIENILLGESISGIGGKLAQKLDQLARKSGWIPSD